MLSSLSMKCPSYPQLLQELVKGCRHSLSITPFSSMLFKAFSILSCRAYGTGVEWRGGFVTWLLHQIKLCVVGVYLTMSMAETSLSVILTIWVLRLHHAGPDQPEMSPRIRRVVLCWLARLVGSNTSSVYGSHRPRRADTASCHATIDKLISRSPGQIVVGLVV